MATELTDLMSRATERLVVDPKAGARVIERYQRRHRRRFVAVGVIAAVGIAAAVGIPLAAGNSGGSDINRIVPAGPSSPPPSPAHQPRASVSGIDVTYLPEGLSPSSNLTLNAMVKENGHPSVSQYYQAANVNPANADTLNMSIAVQRGYTANLETFASASMGSTQSWTTVRGHRALLQTFSGSDSSSSYELTWVESPQLTLTIFSSGKLTLADVYRVANGLIVHPETPLPADPTAATAAIRQTVQLAFSSSVSLGAKLAAIENGQQLAPAIAEFTRKNPELARTIHADGVNVTFVGADQAVASVSLTYKQELPNGQVSDAQPVSADVTVDHTKGRWLVAKSSYCNELSIAVPGLAC